MTGPSAWERNLRNATIVVGAMVQGVLIFAAVVWFMRRGGQAPPPEDSASTIALLVMVWLGVMVVDLGAALFVRSRALAPLEEPGAQDKMRRGELTSQMLLNQTIISWALIEAACLLGIVVYLLGGPQSVLYGTLAYLGLGVALFFPRRESFERFREVER